ncbi:MAG: hypothetical protein ACQXXJ_01755 [Candidatus Bathyarchaeia archaeon]
MPLDIRFNIQVLKRTPSIGSKKQVFQKRGKDTPDGVHFGKSARQRCIPSLTEGQT